MGSTPAATAPLPRVGDRLADQPRITVVVLGDEPLPRETQLLCSHQGRGSVMHGEPRVVTHKVRLQAFRTFVELVVSVPAWLEPGALFIGVVDYSGNAAFIGGSCWSSSSRCCSAPLPPSPIQATSTPPSVTAASPACHRRWGRRNGSGCRRPGRREGRHGRKQRPARLRDRRASRGRNAGPDSPDDGRLTLAFGGVDGATRWSRQSDGKLLVAGGQRLPPSSCG